MVVVEPYLDQAIGIENQNLIRSGVADTPEFWAEYEEYRMWQKGGQVVAGVILGLSAGALFGIVFALSRRSLPARNNTRKALILAGIMWTTIYFIPFLKYPANPPTVGDPDTLLLRIALYLAFVVISGLAAVAFYKFSKRFNGAKKLIALACYGAWIVIAFHYMPDNPDEISISADLLNEFRMASVAGMAIFWASVGLVLGALWDRYKPHKSTVRYS